MKKRPVVILCEDKVHDTFVRRFLRCRGYDSRDIRTVPIPGGSGGAGEKHVRAKFPAELLACRARREAALIVVIDADNGTVEGHRSELDSACKDQGVPVVAKDEAVIRVIPMRNIESWLRYLSSQPWDETSETWKTKREDLVKPAAEKLHEMCYDAQQLKKPSPSSLDAACEEWRTRFR